MRARARTIWIIVILAVAAIILIAGTIAIYSAFFRRGIPQVRMLSDRPLSNGERIYLTGTSRTGPGITARMEGMQAAPPRMLSCAACHGEDGRGRQVRMMMMGTFATPNIRWSHLTEAEHEEAEEHPPYDEETLRQAITCGVDPAGHPLDWQMPRWQMTESQLDDLVAYLKTLD
jgi:cytochrome c oxidase subunit 2